MPVGASLARGGNLQNQRITERWSDQLHRKRQSGSGQRRHDGYGGMARVTEWRPCLELMSSGELAWIINPARRHERTGGQKDIDMPERVDRCDHPAPTLLR
jgi:hypothetical protein